MEITIHPSSFGGQVKIPPSKSLAHRAIICAGLARGQSVIDNIDLSMDIKATLSAMEQLGAKIEVSGGCLTITGVDNFNALAAAPALDCLESGSSLRFLIPVFSLTNKAVRFTGKGRLLERPQQVYESLFRKQGLHFSHNKDEIIIQGALKPGDIEIDGSISSQFISGLLFAMPLLEGDSRIIIKPPLESKPYVDLTLQALRDFAIQAKFTDETIISVPGKQKYQAGNYQVEGDFSQAAFFAVMAAIGNQGRDNKAIDCLGLGHDSLQGDRVIIDILKVAGAKIETLVTGYRISRAPLQALDINISDCPDLGPILMVMAAFAQGESRISGVKRLRYKESDRVAAMCGELGKLGVPIQEKSDDLIIIKGGQVGTASQTIDSHNDHRVVMSMAVAAICGLSPLTINGAQAVNKSYPRFFDDLAQTLCGNAVRCITAITA